MLVKTEIIFLPNKLPPVVCNGHVCFFLPVQQSLNLWKNNHLKTHYDKKKSLPTTSSYYITYYNRAIYLPSILNTSAKIDVMSSRSS